MIVKKIEVPDVGEGESLEANLNKVYPSLIRLSYRPSFPTSYQRGRSQLHPQL